MQPHMERTISNIKSKVLFLLLALSQGAWATDYITDVTIVAGKASRDSKVKEGWTAIGKDLNAGAGGDFIYLLYKTSTNKADAITDFYLRTGKNPPATMDYNGRTYIVPPEGNHDLNRGAGGDYIYLYYTKESFDDERAVTSISFNGTPSGAVAKDDSGMACDLNKGAGGEYIYMHITYPQVNRFPYVQRSWNAKNKLVVEETKVKTISEVTRLDGSNNELGNGWYVVDNNVTYNDIIEIKGNDVNIIVADGMRLNASRGIRIWKDQRLRIFGQTAGTGLVYAHAKSGPGIGGYGNIFVGHLEIHGGIVDAQSGSNSNAGIGSGNGETYTDAGFQSITIYGGTVKAKGASGGAGIGTGKQNNDENIGVINIYGGSVNATGGKYAAGIGGGEYNGSTGYIVKLYWGNGPINIYGGTVVANGGDCGAGIGGGNDGRFSGDVCIYGGRVYATGGKNGDGIGAGKSRLTIDKKLHVENAFVMATGKSSGNSGIRCCDLKIINSEVHAKSDDAGYGPLLVTDHYGGNIFPLMDYLVDSHMGNGMMITYEDGESFTRWDHRWRADHTYINRLSWGNYNRAVEGSRYFKILPCDHLDGIYTDNGDGTHKVRCNYCKNAKNPHTYIYNGAGYFCRECNAKQPEGGLYYSVGKIAYDGTNYEGVADQVYVSGEDEYTLPDCADLDNLSFEGWALVHNLSEVGDSPLPSADEILYPAGYQLRLTDNIILVARYQSAKLCLYNDESNEEFLVGNIYNRRNIALKDRTLWKGDKWNTLCLPFSLSAEELAQSQLNGYSGLKELDVEGYYDNKGLRFTYHENDGETDPMPTGYYDANSTLADIDATALRQTGFDRSTGKLYLYFIDAERIEAGKPYLIKWDTTEPSILDMGDLHAPQFIGVTISNIAPAFITSADESVTFTGTYTPIEIPSTGDNSKLCIEAGNTIYSPRAEMTIGCQRAYFQLNDITTGESDGDVKAVIVNFGDDNTATGITTIQSANTDDTWFDLSGRKLSRKPTRRGIYIHNGEKKVLK